VSEKKTPQQIATTLRRYPPLRPVIAAVGPPPAFRVIPVAKRYEHLVRSIVHQQLAGKAAEAIYGRFTGELHGDVTPDGVLSLSDETMASVGLSGAKRRAINDLTHKVKDGTVRFDRHGRLSNDEIIAELVQVHGVGPWTVHMYLMHALARPDVWPSGDYGVRNGWSIVHGDDVMISAADLATAADHLSPHRSAVAWYCWQAVDVARATDR